MGSDMEDKMPPGQAPTQPFGIGWKAVAWSGAAIAIVALVAIYLLPLVSVSGGANSTSVSVAQANGLCSSVVGQFAQAASSQALQQCGQAGVEFIGGWVLAVVGFGFAILGWWRHARANSRRAGSAVAGDGSLRQCLPCRLRRFGELQRRTYATVQPEDVPLSVEFGRWPWGDDNSGPGAVCRSRRQSRRQAGRRFVSMAIEN